MGDKLVIFGVKKATRPASFNQIDSLQIVGNFGGSARKDPSLSMVIAAMRCDLGLIEN